MLGNQESSIVFLMTDTKGARSAEKQQFIHRKHLYTRGGINISFIKSTISRDDRLSLVFNSFRSNTFCKEEKLLTKKKRKILLYSVRSVLRKIKEVHNAIHFPCSQGLIYPCQVVNYTLD